MYQARARMSIGSRKYKARRLRRQRHCRGQKTVLCTSQQPSGFIARSWLAAQIKERRQIALQQRRVAQLQLQQAAQMRHAVEVNAAADQTHL